MTSEHISEQKVPTSSGTQKESLGTGADNASLDNPSIFINPKEFLQGDMDSFDYDRIDQNCLRLYNQATTIPMQIEEGRTLLQVQGVDTEQVPYVLMLENLTQQGIVVLSATKCAETDAYCIELKVNDANLWGSSVRLIASEVKGRWNNIVDEAEKYECMMEDTIRFYFEELSGNFQGYFLMYDKKRLSDSFELTEYTYTSPHSHDTHSEQSRRSSLWNEEKIGNDKTWCDVRNDICDHDLIDSCYVDFYEQASKLPKFVGPNFTLLQVQNTGLDQIPYLLSPHSIWLMGINIHGVEKVQSSGDGYKINLQVSSLFDIPCTLQLNAYCLVTKSWEEIVDSTQEFVRIGSDTIQFRFRNLPDAFNGFLKLNDPGFKMKAYEPEPGIDYCKKLNDLEEDDFDEPLPLLHVDHQDPKESAPSLPSNNETESNVTFTQSSTNIPSSTVSKQANTEIQEPEKTNKMNDLLWMVIILAVLGVIVWYSLQVNK